MVKNRQIRTEDPAPMRSNTNRRNERARNALETRVRWVPKAECHALHLEGNADCQKTYPRKETRNKMTRRERERERERDGERGREMGREGERGRD
jgi:hypothetical protein